MSEWEKVSFGSIATFKKGINYKSENYCDEGSGYPFITIKCFIKGGGYDATGLKYFDGYLDRSDLLSPEDIIFAVTDLTRAGDIVGSPLRVPDFGSKRLAVASMDCMKVSPQKEFCQNTFLYYLMMLADVRRQMVAYSAGSTVLHLDTKQVPRMTLNIPLDIAEQKKIAKILQTIDQAIESTQVLIEKYQLIKAGLMHDLFTRGIGADGKLRPPREAAPELYQETAIGWIPKEWSLAKLSDLSKTGVPHLKTGPFGSSLKGEHWVNEGVPVITIGSLGEGEFINEELLFIAEAYANLLREYRMKTGEIVFSRVADVGRSVVIGVEQAGWVMSSNLMRIHLAENLMNSAFLQSQLSFDSRIKKQIRCKVNAGGREVANSEILNSLLFVCPSVSEQQLLTDHAEINNQRIQTEIRLLEKLRKQKAGLMHDLLTGKVQVKVAETTPDQHERHIHNPYAIINTTQNP